MMPDVRTPPQDLDAERAALGALLNGPPDADQVFASLPAEAFYVPQHRTIYAIAKELHDAGQPMDATAFIHAARGRGIERELEQADQTLIDLAINLSESFTVPEMLPTYAAIVREHWQRRCLIRLAHQLDDAARNLNEVVVDIVASAVKGVEIVADGGDVEAVAASVVLDECLAVAHEERGTSIATGLQVIDNAIGGIERRSVCVVGARTSVGKTAFALHVGIGACLNGSPALFYSVEMSRQKIGNRIVSNVNGYWFDARKLEPSYAARLVEVAKESIGKTLFIDDATRGISQVIASAKRQIRRHGIALVIVDYLQLLSPQGKHDTHNLAVADMSKQLKKLAMEHDVAVMLLSQLNRESARGGVPMLADLRDSGAIEQDADVVLLLSKADEYANGDDVDIRVRIAKNRNGPTTECTIRFHRPTMRFSCGEYAYSGERN